MKRPNSKLVSGLMTVIFLIAASNLAAQDNYVQEGKGIEDLTVGVSNEKDVISRFGKDFKLIEHGKYSNQLIYEELGLSFYYCYADPNKEIFSINLKKPFDAVTSRGIVLGKSLREDVIKAYGFPGDIPASERVADSNWVREYKFPGVRFLFSSSTTLLADGSNTSEVKVYEISIIEESGLRQCDSKFPKRKNK